MSNENLWRMPVSVTEKAIFTVAKKAAKRILSLPIRAVRGGDRGRRSGVGCLRSEIRGQEDGGQESDSRTDQTGFGFSTNAIAICIKGFVKVMINV